MNTTDTNTSKYDLKALNVGAFWALLISFVFGVFERIYTVSQAPSGGNMGLLTVSTLMGVLYMVQRWVR